MREEAAARAKDACKIAGSAKVNITGDDTVVQLERQEELTRAIHDRVSSAREKQPDDDKGACTSTRAA